MRLQVIALAVIGCLLVPASASARYEYRAGGPYLDYGKRPYVLDLPPASGGPYRISKKLGVLEFYDGLFRPSAADDSVHGLWEYTQYKLGHGRKHLHQAIRAGRWTAQLQEADGKFLYHFSFRVADDGRPLYLQPPWYGAYTQGTAMSLFTRLYSATGNRRWLDRAVLAMGPLGVSTEQGGMSSTFLDTGLRWFEGYASLPVHTHNLAHHVLTLIGLRDLSRFSPQARVLFDEGLAALIRGFPYFDDGPLVDTWLIHLTDPPRAVVHFGAYTQEQVVSALRALNSVHPDPTLASYLRNWHADLMRLCRIPSETCVAN